MKDKMVLKKSKKANSKGKKVRRKYKDKKFNTQVHSLKNSNEKLDFYELKNQRDNS